MNRVLSILGLLILLAGASCAATRPIGPTAQDPHNQSCTACNEVSDCPGDEHCLDGCCDALDDENPLE